MYLVMFISFCLEHSFIFRGIPSLIYHEQSQLTCVCALFNPLKPSGHYMYRKVVTICTASLTFNNSTFCPHSVFMCFVWISEQTVIISLYSINWLVFVTEKECVYCAVRTGSLYIIHIDINFQRLYMLLHKVKIFLRTALQSLVRPELLHNVSI